MSGRHDSCVPCPTCVGSGCLQPNDLPQARALQIAAVAEAETNISTLLDDLEEIEKGIASNTGIVWATLILARAKTRTNLLHARTLHATMGTTPA